MRTDRHYLQPLQQVNASQAETIKKLTEQNESLANRYNFKGYLQCDGFEGYETAFKASPNVLLVSTCVMMPTSLLRSARQRLPVDGRMLTFEQRRYYIWVP